MVEVRGLRRKEAVSYEISSDSDTAEDTTPDDSPFSSPEKTQNPRKRSIINVDEESESDDDPEYAAEPVSPRISLAGHSLRQHKDLNQSLKAQENGDKPVRKKQKATTKKPEVKSDAQKKVPVKTARTQIRETIATETTAKKNNFFVAHRDLFLPLLPPRNYITKLLDQKKFDEQEQDIVDVSDSLDTLKSPDGQLRDLSVPYENLSQQPLGIKATMKPYQLSGLSFLVYLHRNGLSGILGDEMGLGKTLQTLALLQHLKETRNRTDASEQRPSLVVCPLSVLSSWMAEARRWAPGLKVLRFHGPVHERARMKRIATGEVDMFGHETKRHKVKKNDRMIKAGKQVIDLDAEPETANEIGVDLVVTTWQPRLRTSKI